MSKKPWHPADDCVVPLTEALAELVRTPIHTLPERLLSQSTRPSSDLGNVYSERLEVGRRWLEFNVSPEFARVFVDRLLGVMEKVRGWEDRAFTDPDPYEDELSRQVGFCKRLRDDYDKLVDEAAEVADYLLQLGAMLRSKFAETSTAAKSAPEDDKGRRRVTIGGNRLCDTVERSEHEEALRAERQYMESPTKYDDIVSAILDHLRQMETPRRKRAEAEPDPYLRAHRIALEDRPQEAGMRLPVRGDTKEGIIEVVREQFPGTPEDMIDKALEVLIQDGKVFMDETESGQCYNAVWRLRGGPDDSALGNQPEIAGKRPMTDGQKRLWDALEHRALTGKELASQKELDTSKETVRQWVRELRQAGYEVPNRPGRGYYRPDAPPPDAADATDTTDTM